MAASTIDDQYLWLKDMIPGPASFGELPSADADGNIFTNASHHNVATAKYSVGTKVTVYDNTNSGYATLAYLRMGAAGGVTVAAKSVCAPGTSGTAKWYRVSNSSTLFVANSYCAVALSAMTDEYYGWFWVGGVCPVTFVSALDGDFVTADAVVAGGVTVADYVTDDRLAFGPVASAVNAVGLSMSADA